MMEECSASQLTFAATVLGTGFLTVRALIPPNRSPAGQAWRNDTLRFASATASVNRSIALMTVLVLYYAALAVSPPATRAAICPTEGSGQRNPVLFTWSPVTALSFVAIVVGTSLRMGAYSGLGKNFTFGLAKPNGLITNGMYAYVQHPSYTGLALMAVGSFFVFFRLDGAIACFVSLHYWPRLQAWSAALYAGIGLWLILLLGTRVVQEEAMLKELFGTEWERWHAKTKRFIPGVF